MANNTQPRPWHALTIAEISAAFAVNGESGLSQVEARRRLAEFGPNRIRREERESILEVFLEEVREPMILLLLVTGILYSIWGEASDTITIFAVIFTLVAVEVFNERRAERAISALSKLAEPTVAVHRDGGYAEVLAEEVVPGDVVLLQAGKRVPADARLLEAYSLAIDESSLTGESVPVEKEADLTLPEATPLAERRNLIFAGTVVTRGRGSALVVATGMKTEIGRVAGLAQEVEAPRTPLQQAMSQLTGWLVWLALGFSVIVPLLGWLLARQPLRQMLLTGLSLAFATIPEEAPIIITSVLALGAYRLSQQRAIAKRLPAVETLGSVTVIATDKTGTLTENRMEVSRLQPESLSDRLLQAGALCNGASEKAGKFAGDPMETALLRAAHQVGLNVAAFRRDYPLRQEFSFDNARKMMSVAVERDGSLWVVAKGAPEAVLARSDWHLSNGEVQPLDEAERQAILAHATQMAADGLRVLAFAEKNLPTDKLSPQAAESGLTFIGQAGLADPPRPEVPEAIRACRSAGIRPIMVTGDHPATAAAIAREIGLDGGARMLAGSELDALSDMALQETVGAVAIYARTTPEHKLRIVRALRSRGERVAVTGDGTNDAPALAAADIGVAMGETGTDVAREAADIVLADDNFATIVRAVQEGRVLFANLRKGLRYYLACKVALILATLLPVLLKVPVPFAPVQIIVMELFMDLAASATFVAEPAEPDLMRQPPRNPRASFMDRAMVSSIFTSAAGLFAAVSLAYLLTWYTNHDLLRAQTVAFVTWLLGHVLLALNLRSERQPLARLGLFSNRPMVIWGVATIAFIIMSTLVPPVRTALKTALPSGGEWLLAVAAAFVGTFWLELRKHLTR
ncbi:MAG: cation-translocating P-type ATPase [Anaerolineae bacterium]